MSFPITKNNAKGNAKINNYDSGGHISRKDTVCTYLNLVFKLKKENKV